MAACRGGIKISAQVYLKHAVRRGQSPLFAMKIRLDEKHVLNSDARCYWVSTVSASSKTGKENERVSGGYHATFSEAVASYVERFVTESEASTLEELAEEIEQLKHDVRKWEAVVRRQPPEKDEDV